MSEFAGQPDSGIMPQDGSFPAGPVVAVVSAGTLLRQAREAAGLHIAALAVALKVPVKKLEALEADRLDMLHDAVFVRALASSVCRTLNTDVAPVLALLPKIGHPGLDYPRASMNTPFRSPSNGPGPTFWKQASRPAGLLLLLGALVLILLPAFQKQNLTLQPAALLAAFTAAQIGQQPDGADAVAVSPKVSESMNPPDAEPANLLAVVPSPVAPRVVPDLVTTLAPTTPVATGLIAFSAKGESWVEVTDAVGAVVLRRTLAAGEAAHASGALPLTAVVGRADVTQVQVRGQPFDLSAVSKDNVARFEVK